MSTAHQPYVPDILPIHFAERAFRDEDLDALEKIERAAGDARWTRRQLEYAAGSLEIDTRVITTAGEPGQPIAFYVVEHGDETLYLCNLAVATEWRRRGVAVFALEAAAEMGRSLGYAGIALHVQEENLPAQLLYRKAGFRATSIQRKFYGGQDGYHMEKDLRTG
jgi:ribosomal protein S18 acetylase RimI-like enzyme